MERLSMFSQVVLAKMMETVQCPKCHEMNIKNAKPTIELTDHGAWCSNCGADWIVTRPIAKVVT